MKRFVFFWAIVLLTIGTITYAQSTFDSIHIDLLDVKADISEYADVNATYILINKEENFQTVTLGFLNLPESAELFENNKQVSIRDGTAEISFGSKEGKRLLLRFKKPVENVFNYDINLQVNNMYLSDSISRACVEYNFPASYTVLEATGKIVKEDDMTKVLWDEKDFPSVFGFVSSFEAYFAREKIEIDLYKESDKVAAKRGEKVNVKIHLKNSGKERHNLQLTELIDRITFIPEITAGSLQSSGIITSLTWDVESLKQGEEKIIEYSLTVIQDMEMDVDISPTKLKIGNVEMHSNPLKIHIEGETPKTPCIINGLCESEESYLTCPADCPSGGRDDYCDKLDDGICDPDCSAEEDVDCKSGKLGESYLVYYIVIIILLVPGLFIIYRKIQEKKKWDKLETKYSR